MQQDEQKNNEKGEVKPIVEEADWSRPDYSFEPKGNHLWRQSGYYLICGSCDLEHAIFIGKDKIMEGKIIECRIRPNEKT